MYTHICSPSVLGASVLSLLTRQQLTEGVRSPLFSQSKHICLLWTPFARWAPLLERRHTLCKLLLHVFFLDTTLSRVTGSKSWFSKAQCPFLPQSGQNTSWFSFPSFKMDQLNHNTGILQGRGLIYLYLFDLCRILSKRSLGVGGGA